MVLYSIDHYEKENFCIHPNLPVFFLVFIVIIRVFHSNRRSYPTLVSLHFPWQKSSPMSTYSQIRKGIIESSKQPSTQSPPHLFYPPYIWPNLTLSVYL